MLEAQIFGQNGCIYVYKVQRLFVSALCVCGKLPTYRPSLNPTFCVKWEVSINVSLRKGRWAVFQKSIIILSSLGGCDHAKNFSGYIRMPAWTTLHKNKFCCSENACYAGYRLPEGLDPPLLLTFTADRQKAWTFGFFSSFPPWCLWNNSFNNLLRGKASQKIRRRIKKQFIEA